MIQHRYQFKLSLVSISVMGGGKRGLEIICMKCQILFSGKNMKNIINLSSTEFVQSVDLKNKIFQKGLSGHNFIGAGTSLRIVGKSRLSKNKKNNMRKHTF